jgi:hypothetical protein
VTATDMQFIGSASDRDSGYASDNSDMEAPEPASSSAAAGAAPSNDDDIPF